MDTRLQSHFLGIPFKSPLVLASGIVDISYSSMLKCIELGAGAVTTKSLTKIKRKGHEGPVLAEFEGGFLNSMGLSNPGIEDGIKEVEEFKTRTDAPVILSIFATSAESFLELIHFTNESKADAVELNLSCPNVGDEFGLPLAASEKAVGEIVSAVAPVSRLPLIAKLSPNTYNVAAIGKAAINAGAQALTLVNTLGPGMLIDIHARRPVFPGKFGGVSGPALKPIALKYIYETSQLLHCPIIGTGGVTTGEDAIQFLMAGAGVIGVGTSVYYRGIDVFTKINEEIIDYMDKHSLNSISEITLAGE